MNNEIDIILARYFSGEATEKELQALDVWLSESDENEKQFHQMTLLYQYAGQTGDLPTVDTEKALTQFKNYISEKQINSNKPIFTISRIWRAAAAIAILVIGTFALFHFINPSSKTVRLIAVETQKTFTIFENTEVTLFPGTEIIFHTQSNREVQLIGKATFKIDSEISGGILVQAGETYIEDVGTIFTVDASTLNISITVEVTDGEVWFYTDINSGVYIKANEGAVYNVQTKQFTMIERSGEPMCSPTTERSGEPTCSPTTPLQPELVFQNTSLTTAIDLIKTRYGVDIMINSNELNEMLLNVSFDNHESVEYVLDIIAATIFARVEKRGNQYIITSDD